MVNYSFKIIQANAEASDLLLGVRLGRFCITNNISVRQVAKDLDVTKSVVYKWFTGKNDVSKHLKDKVQAHYDALTKGTPGAPNTNYPCPDSTS